MVPNLHNWDLFRHDFVAEIDLRSAVHFKEVDRLLSFLQLAALEDIFQKLKLVVVQEWLELKIRNEVSNVVLIKEQELVKNGNEFGLWTILRRSNNFCESLLKSLSHFNDELGLVTLFNNFVLVCEILH